MLSFILLELSFSEIISDIPLNAGTILVVVLFALFGGFIWYGSRSSGSKPAGSALPVDPARAQVEEAEVKSGMARR